MKINLDLAKQLWAEGKTDVQVAKEVGASVATLRAYKRRLGLTVPRTKKASKTTEFEQLPAETAVDLPKPVISSIVEEQPIDLHFVLNEEEIYLHARSAGCALELLAYLTTIIQSEGAAVHGKR